MGKIFYIPIQESPTAEGKMSRRFTPKIVTANRLREGDVVYLTADDLVVLPP